MWISIFAPWTSWRPPGDPPWDPRTPAWEPLMMCSTSRARRGRGSQAALLLRSWRVEQAAGAEVCSARCFYAGADEAVCPVSLVDFYLRAGRVSVRRWIHGQRGPVQRFIRLSSLPPRAPGDSGSRCAAPDGFTGISESVRNRERSRRQVHGADRTEEGCSGVSPGPEARNQLVGSAVVSLVCGRSPPQPPSTDRQP